LDLAAYWIANFTADVIKLLIVLGASLITIQANGLEWNNAYAASLLFPFAIVPMTYAASFFFA
jgi:hypothetical protein